MSQRSSHAPAGRTGLKGSASGLGPVASGPGRRMPARRSKAGSGARATSGITKLDRHWQGGEEHDRAADPFRAAI